MINNNHIFELINASSQDRKIYYQIKKQCCKKYVKKHFRKWVKKQQKIYNDEIFEQSLLQTCFKCVKRKNKTVGFFGYTISNEEIGCITLQIKKCKKRKIIFEYLLNHICCLAQKHKLPIYAKCFLDNKDIYIYKKFGFEITSTNTSHCLLKNDRSIK